MDARLLLLIGVLVPFSFFTIILIVFMIRRKKIAKSQSAVLQRLINSESSKATSAFYQKMYNKLVNIPFVNRYVYKIRRRLELINNDDEYMIRNDTAKIALKNIFLALAFSILLAYINRDDLFMMMVSMIGVLVVIENMTERGVNRIEDRLLTQQLDFLSEVRHAFHTTNMVEEAIYDASIMEEYEITAQANRIYEILISADPEMELERYYDVAPNRFLKAFAGVSYLTKEFGDRRIGGVSLYLKDLNNITQELQMEVLKRDKLDYLFKSLTYIAVLPVLAIKPLENWAMSSFNATIDFYEGKLGFLVQMLLLVTVFVSYALLTRIKDNGGKQKVFATSPNDVWQERVYRLPIVENIIDGLIPSVTSKKYNAVKTLLKDTASRLRIEWLYVNRCICALAGFCVAIIIIMQMHNLAVTQIMYSATKSSNGGMGQMTEQDTINANGVSSFDRYFLNVFMNDNKFLNAVRTMEQKDAIKLITNEMLKISSAKLDNETAEWFAKRIYKELGSTRLDKLDIQYAIIESRIELPRENFTSELAAKIINISREEELENVTEKTIKKALIEIYNLPLTQEQASAAASRIYEKLKTLTSEYFAWYELAIAIFVGLVMYQAPILMLKFQKRMRYMEMEDEVMQFQTIILMLMHIERVSVEYMLEWLERFSNIFKEPLAKCLNNYESGAYEALEELKDDAPFKPFVRIVESLQSAVESVKITDAFDELESERAFFQEKRKEANDRLIAKKAKIGKILGFAPMVMLFVGYLIGPMMIASLSDMGSYFTDMGASM